MAGIKELIRTEEDNTLSFGNYDLPTKGRFRIMYLTEMYIR